jgi:hypothetical protein
MTRARKHLNPQPQPAQSGRAFRHPPWCDPTRCIADPVSQTDRYRSGTGGEHRSAPVPIRLTSAVLLPVRDGTAWLSEACAPWPCDTYLRVQVGELDLPMPAADARHALAALSALLCVAATEGVTCERQN